MYYSKSVKPNFPAIQLVEWLRTNGIRVVSDEENSCGVEKFTERVDLEIACDPNSKQAD